MPRKIDQFFKNKVGNHSAPYRNEDWAGFESMLDGEETAGYSDRLLWIVLLFVFFSFMLFIPGSGIFSGSQGENRIHVEDEGTILGSSSTVGVLANRADDKSDFGSPKGNGFFSSISAAYLPEYEVVQRDYVENNRGQSRFSYGAEDDQNRSASALFNEGLPDGSGDFNRLLSGAYDLVLVSASSLPQAEWSLLTLDPSASLPNELSELDYQHPSRMRFGLGALIGDENLSDFGVFLEASYPLSSLFDVSVRPGLIYSSLSNEKDVYFQEQYDFGRSELQIELETTGRIQLDLPVFIAINSNRHRFGIGGGVRLNLGERFEEKQTQISDKNRVGGRAVEEVVVDRSDWRKTSTRSRPFVEGFYQYQINPDWFLGLRSRLTFESSELEGAEGQNALHYGVILTYALN